MLQVSNLSYRYPGSADEILKSASLTVNKGEIVALVGQNGSGKSTLGRVIAGILALQAGTVSIDGSVYTKHSKGIRNDLGIVFQNPENQLLFENYDEEVRFALSELSPDDLDERIQESLAAVGMNKFRHRGLDELSLGQKQRLVIAETLARGSHYLILDEPTTMIDSAGKREIAKLVTHLKRAGYAILYITNLADEILLADRILVLADGKIAAKVKRTELLEKAKVLQRYHIELPTMLRLLLDLRQQGVEISSAALEIPQFVSEIKAKIHG